MTDDSLQTDSFFKRHWKLILNIITMVALLALVYFIRDQLVETLRNLRHVNPWVLLSLIPLQLLNYHAQTRMYQDLFRIVGNALPYKLIYRAAVELNFVNHVFPSGGVSGVSYFGVRMRDGTQLSAAKATLVQVMKVALTILSFEILLVAGLIFLAVVGKANGLLLFTAGALTMLIIFGTMLFMYLIGSQHRINVFFLAVTKALNKLIQFVRRGHPETISIDSAHKVFDDLHGNYMEFRNRYHELRAPFWWAVMANVTEVACLYAVYIAFGEWVNVGAVILAYAVANFAGFVSVLPGGVGIYEFLMTAVLSAGGIPAAVSLPVTVMYRVLNTLIQVPPGFFLYRKTVKDAKG